jgi:hypothetical protein
MVLTPSADSVVLASPADFAVLLNVVALLHVVKASVQVVKASVHVVKLSVRAVKASPHVVLVSLPRVLGFPHVVDWSLVVAPP